MKQNKNNDERKIRRNRARTLHLYVAVAPMIPACEMDLIGSDVETRTVNPFLIPISLEIKINMIMNDKRIVLFYPRVIKFLLGNLLEEFFFTLKSLTKRFSPSIINEIHSN